MNPKELSTSIMRYQDDINTEHNIKSICRAAVAHWTRTGLTRVDIQEAYKAFASCPVKVPLTAPRMPYTSVYSMPYILNKKVLAGLFH